MPELQPHTGVLALTALISIALAGCSNVAPPVPIPDAGGPIDALVVDYRDTDGDGLCDSTELSRGTDPGVRDTDGDGLSDRVEVDFGFDPIRTDSPDRELLVRLAEASGSEVRLSIAHVVYGSGETYTGGFQPGWTAGDLDASAFYTGSVAFGATPRANVFEIVPEEARFVGVSDRTELLFELRFETPASVEPLGCLRGYPWRYDIKRDDGGLVFARRYILVVGPEDGAEWCAPQGCI